MLLGLLTLRRSLSPRPSPRLPQHLRTHPSPHPGPTSPSALRELLAEQAKTYRYLGGVTIHEGPTPQGEQAVSYYTDGEIVISPDHTATLEDIVAHEIWHVIDWRDNGRIDWGEQLPPANSSDYLK